jgi:hypothetical protein
MYVCMDVFTYVCMHICAYVLTERERARKRERVRARERERARESEREREREKDASTPSRMARLLSAGPPGTSFLTSSPTCFVWFMG